MDKRLGEQESWTICGG